MSNEQHPYRGHDTAAHRKRSQTLRKDEITMILRFADSTPEWILNGQKTVDCRVTANPLPKVGTTVQAKRVQSDETFATLKILKVWTYENVDVEITFDIIRKEGYQTNLEFWEAYSRYNREKLKTPGMTTYFFEFEVIQSPDEKVRQDFTIENDNGKVVAKGVRYREGNVQILWREDTGYTGEQYANIGNTFGIVPGANVIRLK